MEEKDGHRKQEIVEGRQEMNGGSRKKQIFQGVVKTSVIHKLNTLIICEFWPSVIVGLETNTSRKLWIYAEKMPVELRTILPAHITWVNKAEVAEIVREQRMETTVMQGTPSFLEKVNKMNDLWSLLNYCY